MRDAHINCDTSIKEEINIYVLIMTIYLEKKRGRGKERDGESMEGRTERDIYVAST